MRIYDQELGVSLHEFLFAVFMKGTGYDVTRADHNDDEYDGYMSNKRIMIVAYLLDPSVEGTDMLNHWDVVQRVAHALWSNRATMEMRLKFAHMMAERRRDAAQRKMDELAKELAALGPRLVANNE